MLNAANERSISSAAARVRLVIVVDPVARELYGVAVPVIDEAATLRRVACLYRGTGSYGFTPEEKEVAVRAVRGRADELSL